MIGALRHVASLGLAFAATLWLLFRAPAPGFGAGPPAGAAPALSVETLTAGAEEPGDPAPEDEAPAAPEDAPMAPVGPGKDEAPRAPEESGTIDGMEDGELFDRVGAEEPAPTRNDHDERARAEAALAARALAEEVRALQRDEDLLGVARSEVEGDVKRGFQTVLYSDPEDQLDIARAFGEQVVLVPRAALDPGAASEGVRSFRLDPASGRIIEVPGRPALDRFRQYRDLLGYEFARLPEPMRELRKLIVRRDEIFVFAALVPAGEWALVVARRRAALRQHGATEEDVARFELRYVRLPGGSFDLRVDRIVLADGRVIAGGPASR
ncbi:MAG: hypothetical protein VX460_10390 [Planctomycetota bacterium]|nr:hypothetical protein [Planctomycetota bacterium]